jgi:hypothetical protein
MTLKHDMGVVRQPGFLLAIAVVGTMIIGIGAFLWWAFSPYSP